MSWLDLDTWYEIWLVVRRNRLRAALTAFGVFWGVLMLLGMLGFGNGLERGARGEMAGTATNAVWLWGRRTSLPYQGLQAGRSIDYDNSDTEALRSEVAGVRTVAPRLQLGGHRGGANVRHGTETGNYSVAGDVPEFREVQPMVFDAGRFINALDVERERKVAVIGKTVRDELYARGEDPIGSWIEIQGVWFQVVGTFHSPSASDAGDQQSSTVHVPFTTYQRAFNVGDRVGWFAITGEDDVSASELEARVRAVLARRHRIHPDDEPAIGSHNTEREFGRIQSLFSGIRAFVWVVGTATLLSGVVGVSNILLISVRERTSEIGLRRALGASASAVVRMVLLEAVVLTTIAGYAGVVCGVFALEVAGWFVASGAGGVMGRPDVDVSAALGAAGLLAVSGLLAGILPARRAVAIQPVDALRTE